MLILATKEVKENKQYRSTIYVCLVAFHGIDTIMYQP